MKTVFRWLIHFYRLFISPMLGPHCRFYPTCSQYALEAFEQHSFARASWLISRRLARCQPWGGSGYDPVPPASKDEDHHDQRPNSSQRGVNLARQGCDCPQHGYTTSSARHRNRKFTPYTSLPRKAHLHSYVLMNSTGSTFS